MTWKEATKPLAGTLQWVAIGLIVAALYCLMVSQGELAVVSQIIIGVIEGYLIYAGYATITQFYIPILPKKYDWPIALIVPIMLIVKAALMWTNKEQITVWWVAGAIVESWIAAHLCSFERDKR